MSHQKGGEDKASVEILLQGILYNTESLQS